MQDAGLVSDARTPANQITQRTYPAVLILEVASFVVNTIFMLCVLQEFHFLQNVLPFLITKQEREEKKKITHTQSKSATIPDHQ